VNLSRCMTLILLMAKKWRRPFQQERTDLFDGSGSEKAVNEWSC
jgi:hypothetical protein